MTLDLIYLVATDVSTDRALDLTWTEVEFRTTRDLVEGLTLQGACRAEVIYSTSCLCTGCGTGCVEQERRVALEQEREGSFVWGEGAASQEGAQNVPLFLLLNLPTNSYKKMAACPSGLQRRLQETTTSKDRYTATWTQYWSPSSTPSASLEIGDVLSR